MTLRTKHGPTDRPTLCRVQLQHIEARRAGPNALPRRELGGGQHPGELRHPRSAVSARWRQTEQRGQCSVAGEGDGRGGSAAKDRRRTRGVAPSCGLARAPLALLQSFVTAACSPLTVACHSNLSSPAARSPDHAPCAAHAAAGRIVLVCHGRAPFAHACQVGSAPS